MQPLPYLQGQGANNGVILITTKQGKARVPPQISYKFNLGSNRRREGYHYVNARDYIYYTQLGHLNSQRTLAQANSSRDLIAHGCSESGFL